MQAENLQEYQEVRNEIVRVQDCITEYMKGFFAVGAAVFGLLWYLSRSYHDQLSIVGALDQKRMTEIANPLLDFDFIQHICIVASFVILAFSHILFHKLNTHNRYAGYARALSYESFVSLNLGTNLSQRTHRNNYTNHIHLWEICLHQLYGGSRSQSGPNFDEIAYINANFEEKCDLYFNNIHNVRKKFGDIVIHNTFKSNISNSSHLLFVFGFILNFYFILFQSLEGFRMTMLTVIRRVETKSWTYAYVISFGLFSVAASFIVFWGYLFFCIESKRALTSFFFNEHGEAEIEFGSIFQILCMIYILLGWLGMFRRLYRLCSLLGDRTTEFYMYKFLVVRLRILNSKGIRVAIGQLPNVPRIMVERNRAKIVYI